MSENLRLDFGGSRPEGLNIGRLLRTFVHQLPLFIVAAAVGGGLGFGAQMAIPAKYTSSTELLLDPKRADAFGADASFANNYVDSIKVASVVSVMQSSELLRRVVQKQKLVDDPAFGLSKPSTLSKWLSLVPFIHLPPVLDDDKIRADRALERLTKALRVNRSGATYVLTVDVTSPDPTTSQKLAEAVAEEYLEDQVETKVSAAGRDTQWLNDRLTELRRQLEASERQAEIVRAKYNLPDIGHRGDGVLDRQAQVLRRSLGLPGSDDSVGVPGGGPTSAELTNELWKTRLDLALRNVRCDQIQQSVRNHESLDGLPEVANSHLVEELRLQQSDLARRVAALKSVFSDSYPELAHAQEDLRVNQGRIAAEVARIAQGVCSDYKIQVAREQALSARVNQTATVEQSADGIKGRMELLQAQRVVNTNQGLYDSVLERQREVEKQLIPHEAEARIISAAKLPRDPSWPKPFLLPFGGALLGFVSSIGTTMLLPKLKGKLATPSDVEKILAVPVLATVPELKRRDLKLNRRKVTAVDYIIHQPMSRFAESLRMVRAVLQSRHLQRSRIVQVTSAAPGEGKSTIATAITISAARAGLNTVLVDADTRRASISQMLATSAKPVSVPSMVLPEQFKSCTYDCGKFSIDVVSAGSLETPQPDIVANLVFADLIRMLSTQYDIVIVDSPPILAVSDPLAIANLVDETLLVIDAGATRKNVVQEALKAIRTVGPRLSGVILNRAQDGEIYQQYAATINRYYSTNLLSNQTFAIADASSRSRT